MPELNGAEVQSGNVSEQNSDVAYDDVTDECKVFAHMQYLQNLLLQEDNRLNLIETKAAQFIGQTGLAFSLLSVFVPLLADKLDGTPLLLKIILLILLLTAFAFYFLTIHNALKNYNVKNFRYISPHPRNVVTFRDKSLTAFYSEIVRDLLYGLRINSELNDLKADNLIKAFRKFQVANILTALLVLIFCLTLLTNQPKVPSVQIDKPIKIVQLDSLVNKPTFINIVVQKDTLIQFPLAGKR